MRGSVNKAKEKMKWIWIIPITIMFATHIILMHEINEPSDYWLIFIVIGVIWNFAMTSYLIGKIWKKVNNRFVDIIVKKITNYHRLSILALLNKDYHTVKVILDKCLPKYDPSSIMTHFIFGAYCVGSHDTATMNKLIKEIEDKIL